MTYPCSPVPITIERRCLMAQKKCLPIPDGIRAEEYCMKCGALAIVCMAMGSVNLETIRSTKLHTIFKGFLPWHIVASLESLGLRAKATVIRGGRTEKISFLTQNIDLGHNVSVFTGLGSGHWLIVYGYDRTKKIFMVYDTSRKAVRDENGLTAYTYDDLLRAWGQQAWLTRLLSFLLLKRPAWFSEELRTKLESPPFTAVTALV